MKKTRIYMIFRNLPSSQHDDLSKLDPFVKVYQTVQDKAELESIGKTEPILDEVNPEWIEVFWIVHKPGTSQVNLSKL